MKILKDLEYIIPLLSGMPNWVKCLVIVWTLLFLFLLFTIVSINYKRNKQKAILEENFNLEKVKTQVNRLIEDFDSTAKKIVEGYPKEINRIKEQYNKNGTFRSSMHIRKQYDTAIEYKKKIDTAYKDLTRQIQDLMLANFKNKDINTIPQMHSEAEQVKNLYQKYKEEKKKFEEEPRKLDLQMNKNNPIINEDFQMTKY